MCVDKHNVKIQKIKNLANHIDSRINLFEGYTPKKIEDCKNELLFWKQIINYYGLFSDCDRYQVKRKNSLIKLMKENGLITKDDYKMINKLWRDISDFRAWFCHNNNHELYYIRNRSDRIGDYLGSNFSYLPKGFRDVDLIKESDWAIISNDFEKRFEKYLDILESGLEAWLNSSEKGELVTKWISLFSAGLHNDRELINNVLADIAQYEITNNNLSTKTSILANQYRMRLEKEYKLVHIVDELNRKHEIRTNARIVSDSIINSNILKNLTCRTE